MVLHPCFLDGLERLREISCRDLELISRPVGRESTLNTSLISLEKKFM